MKIAHVVTYLSADHAFGGPLSVARAQLCELVRRGHDVELLTGWDGQAELDVEGAAMHRFPVRTLVPGAGFSGLVAPGLVRALESSRYDVVHLHLARDLITLPAARRLRARRAAYVLQPHGMVMPDGRLRARLVDAVATRAVLLGASTVLTLTDEEEAGLVEVAGSTVASVRVPNGVAAPRSDIFPRDSAVPGQDAAEVPDVLFLARLHPRKRVQAFAEMAALLVQRGVKARFSVVGPDEGELSGLEALLRRESLSAHVHYEGPIAADAVPARLARAAIFVLPSVNEPFPMTVLEALAAGTPTVVTDTCHIAHLLRRHEAAVVTDGTPRALADAVEDILGAPQAARRLQDGGRRALQQEFSIEAVVDRLETIYAAAREAV